MNQTGVSEHALIKRINRKLREQKLRLHKARTRNAETGSYDIVESEGGRRTATDVDPKELARELGVLHKRETVRWAS